MPQRPNDPQIGAVLDSVIAALKAHGVACNVSSSLCLLGLGIDTLRDHGYCDEHIRQGIELFMRGGYDRVPEPGSEPDGTV
jgi:hypothetical protein